MKSVWKASITSLISMFSYLLQQHTGPTLLSASLASSCLVVKGHTTIRSVYHQCITCRHMSVESTPQIMGDLPIERVTPGLVKAGNCKRLATMPRASWWMELPSMPKLSGSALLLCVISTSSRYCIFSTLVLVIMSVSLVSSFYYYRRGSIILVIVHAMWHVLFIQGAWYR